MAIHEIKIRENTGAIVGDTVYTGNYQVKGTIRLAQLAEEVARDSGLPAIQSRAIIEGEFNAIREIERERLTRIKLDGFSVYGMITGSFPTSDAPINPEVNKFQLALQLDDSVRNALSDIVPSIVTDATSTRVKISEVADIASPKPYEVLYGTRQFLVHGYNLVLTDEGSSIYLEGKNGTAHEVVVDEALDLQNVKAHAADNLEPGDYRLIIKSRGGDAEGILQTAPRRIKYIQIPETMKITNIVDVEQEAGVVDVVTKGTRINMYGENLGPFEWEQGTSLLKDATLTVTYTDTNDETQTQDILIDAMKSATQQGGGAYLAIGAGESLWQDRVKAGTRPTITFTHVIDGVTHRASRSFALVG